MIALPWEGNHSVSQWFGGNPHFYARWGLAGHNGLDVAMPVGTPLRAVEPGVVLEVAHDPGGYGYYVKLRSDYGHDWLYAHLSLSGLPWVGDRFLPGERVASSGNSGNSTGPHLHLGYRADPTKRGWPFNGYVDPVPFIGVEQW